MVGEVKSRTSWMFRKCVSLNGDESSFNYADRRFVVGSAPQVADLITV